MLRHLELADLANRVEAALLATLAEGIRTPDIGGHRRERASSRGPSRRGSADSSRVSRLRDTRTTCDGALASHPPSRSRRTRALWSGRDSGLSRDLFARAAPLEVEIGSGKARFLIEAARANPAHDFLGSSASLSYYRICRDRVARSGLENVRVLRADGRLFAEALAPGSVRAFHVYFPDPWPKKKQRKRRLLDGVTLEILADAARARRNPPDRHRPPGYGTTIEPLLESVPAFERLAWDALPAPPPTHYELKYRARAGRSGGSFCAGAEEPVIRARL